MQRTIESDHNPKGFDLSDIAVEKKLEETNAARKANGQPPLNMRAFRELLSKIEKKAADATEADGHIQLQEADTNNEEDLSQIDIVELGEDEDQN